MTKRSSLTGWRIPIICNWLTELRVSISACSKRLDKHPIMLLYSFVSTSKTRFKTPLESFLCPKSVDSEDCKQCAKVLTEIEHIDDEADASGINFVKIHDKDMAKEFGIFALPAIVFFKTGSKEPLIYAGEFHISLMSWLKNWHFLFIPNRRLIRRGGHFELVTHTKESIRGLHRGSRRGQVTIVDWGIRIDCCLLL